MRLEFKKMSGAGNDFIVIDNRMGSVPEEGRRERFAAWCQRRINVGADGVLLVEQPENPAHHFRMRYYNADGGEAESCGNGARCIARFAHLIGAAPQTMMFETMAGPYQAEIGKLDVTIGMSDPFDLRRSIEISVPDLFEGEIDFINTGVPHAVMTVEEGLELTPVVELGAKIRYHSEFSPAGTNVNFICKRNDGGLDIRTYERGVEDETLACGTGAVASALIAHLDGYGVSPIPVHTKGGPVLTVHFENRGEMFSQIQLQGEARVVFDGVLEF